MEQGARAVHDVAGSSLKLVWCPGCACAHGFDVAPGRWSWNGDYASPAVSPSLLVRWTEGPEREARRCHSFIRNGRFEFLADCAHDLAGQMVELEQDW